MRVERIECDANDRLGMSAEEYKDKKHKEAGRRRPKKKGERGAEREVGVGGRVIVSRGQRLQAWDREVSGGRSVAGRACREEDGGLSLLGARRKEGGEEG